MPPLRLVLDTNLLVSAALNRKGLPRRVFFHATSKSARLYVTRPILDEYAEVLMRTELDVKPTVRERMIQLVGNHSHLVVSSHRLQVSRDPSDNKFLECADAARADYLITGNLKHFPSVWKKTRIVSAREFLGLVAPHLDS
jgi:putative PIN family toxin of toxin-antitoxin system